MAGLFQPPWDLQQRIAHVLQQVPAGSLLSYKLLAQACACASVRHVASRLRFNNDFPRVPCHRVVHSDGRVGGWFGDNPSPQKQQLLAAEGIVLRAARIVEVQHYWFDCTKLHLPWM